MRILSGISSHILPHILFTSIQFTPMARSLFFPITFSRAIFLTRFAPQSSVYPSLLFAIIYSSNVSLFSGRHWASVSHEMGRDRHRWAGARRRPACVSDYPDRDLSLSSEQRGHDESRWSSASLQQWFLRSIARNAGCKSRTPRASDQATIGRARRGWTFPRKIRASHRRKNETLVKADRSLTPTNPSANRLMNYWQDEPSDVR